MVQPKTPEQIFEDFLAGLDERQRQEAGAQRRPSTLLETEQSLIPPALRQFQPEPRPAPELEGRTVTPSGEVIFDPQLGGAVPAGTNLEQFTETLGLPFTLAGGYAIDAFNRIIKRQPTDKGFLESPVGVLQRQQARGLVPRLASELVTPFDVGAIAGGVRGLARLAAGATGREAARPTVRISAIEAAQQAVASKREAAAFAARARQGIGGQLALPPGAARTAEGAIIAPGKVPPTVPTAPRTAVQGGMGIGEPAQQVGMELGGRGRVLPGRFRPERSLLEQREQAKRSYIEARVPDPPPAQPPPQPPAPPGGRGPRPPVQPPSPGPPEIPPLVGRVAAGKFPWERPDQVALDLHAAAIRNDERRARLLMQDGTKMFKAIGLGRHVRGQWVPRTEDLPKMDELFDALHHPSEIEAGTRQIPAGMEAQYQQLRSLTDWESAARLDFDPEMATVTDYFYRGWKPPAEAFVNRQGTLIRNPAFRMPRAEATYREMRNAGFEPLSWNPFEQWRVSRMQGVKYRQQMELVDFLKGMGDELIQPHQGGTPPKGWRVPQVGPAFEGKPFAFIDAKTGKQGQGFTERWITLDGIANVLENAYGKRPSLGKLGIGGRSIDPLAIIDWLTFVPKRVKLFGSFFQQVDFLTRAGIGSWAGGVNALRTGHPVASVKHIIGYPGTARDIIGSFFSPNWRSNLARRLDDTTPIDVARPGVNVKAISESGLNITDPTFFGRDPLELDAIMREVIQEGKAAKVFKAVPRAFVELERLMRQGLFGGVYPAAIINDVVKNIAPQMLRQYGHMTDVQLNRGIAHAANTVYSSLPSTQSVIQNRVLRETLMRVMFSLNENEGLLRQATKTLPVGFRFSKKGLPVLTRGAGFSKFWVDRWLGAFAFLITTANLIHFASTGKPLPKDRYSPISADKWGPLPFGYNTEFASPNIPLTGKGGVEIMLDIVGQMDTALRVLDPKGFIGARESVPIRAFKNQTEAEDFYGRPIDEEGPGGVFSRTTQLLQDLFAPIGAGQAASNIAVQKVPQLEPFISAGEEKLGIAGQAVQGLGLNLRGETMDDAVRRLNPGYDNLTPEEQKQVKDKLIREVFGARTRRDNERFQEKIWELFPPTDAEREKFKRKMDAEFGGSSSTPSRKTGEEVFEDFLRELDQRQPVR